MTSTTMPLAISGSMISHSVRNELAPSIFAASAISDEMVSKTPRMIRMLTARLNVT